MRKLLFLTEKHNTMVLHRSSSLSVGSCLSRSTTIYLLDNGLLVDEHEEKCSSNNDNVYRFVKRKCAQFWFI